MCHVFKELLAFSKVPEVKLFVRLQKVFNQIANSIISFAVSDPDELRSVLQQLHSAFLQDALIAKIFHFKTTRSLWILRDFIYVMKPVSAVSFLWTSTSQKMVGEMHLPPQIFQVV